MQQVTYGVTTRVSAPIEVYQRTHAVLMERAGEVEGLLLHLGRPTPDGFEVLEVWESRDQFERYTRELVGPLLGEVLGADAASLGTPSVEEFDVRGLVIPRGGIVF